MNKITLNNITYPSAQAAFEACTNIGWLTWLLNEIGWPGCSYEDYLKIVQAALADYDKIKQAALAEYEKFEQATWAEYDKIEQAAGAEYDKIEQAAGAEYDKIVQPARAEYNKIKQAAWAEYNKIKQAAWAEYDKIVQAARAEFEKIRLTWIKANIQVKGNEAYYIPEQRELILSGLDLAAKGNNVNHPTHYNTIPGVECIDVVQHMNFNRGNAVKYIWRAGLKGDVVEDLEKAIWYLQREISLLRSK